MSRIKRFLQHLLRLRPPRRRRRRRPSAGRDRRRLGRRRRRRRADARRGAARRRRRRPQRRAATANVVNEIYQRDGQGVAFIEADQAAQRAEPSPVRSLRRAEGGGTATGSGFVIDTRATSSPTTTSSTAPSEIAGQARRLRRPAYDAEGRRHRPGDRRRAAQGRRPRRPAPPAGARRLLEGRGRRPGGRDRQPLRPRPHRDQRHRLRPAAPDRGAQRLLDLAT